MRVGVARETRSPLISGVALIVAGFTQGTTDAGHGVQLIRPRQDCDGWVAGSTRGIRTLQARSAA